MVAQKGTLNLVGDGAYLVLSLPVSSLRGVDDDRDGLLSLAELQAHAKAVEAQVLSHVKLSDAQGARPLEGLLLNLSPPDETPNAPAPQLVVIGRFALASKESKGLQLALGAFGTAAEEQTFSVTVSYGEANQALMFTPKQRQHSITLTCESASAASKPQR